MVAPLQTVVARLDPLSAKSESFGTLLALGAPALGALAIAAAIDSSEPGPLGITGVVLMFAGPSAGHIYAGEYSHALVTTAIRAGGIALAAASADGHESE